MQINCKVSVVLGLCVVFLTQGCGNSTTFTGASAEKRGGSDATKQETPPQSEQDEIPSTTNNEDDPSNPSEPGVNSKDDESPIKKPEEPKPESFKIEREFITTIVEESTFKFTPKLGIMEQEFALTSTYQNVDKSFTQITRPNVTKMYKQGNPGQSKTENLLQADQGILDLLIVIDDSGSMKEEQANLKNKLPALLEYIKDSDWRIGVVTTDPARGCSRAVIKKGDSGINATFAAAIDAGIAGTGNEQGIRMAVEGLSCPTAQFVRPNSTVAVLIVSDEDNCSLNGGDCPNTAWNTPTYLTNYLANTMKRKLGTDARVYGLYWDPAKTCPGAANKAIQYAKAVADTSGTAGSICDADYTTTLQNISQNVATILKAEFTLKSMPDMGSVKVKVNGVLQNSGYQITGDVLRFTDIPPKAATIEVTYTVGAIPLLARYGMGEPAASGTLNVRVNGSLVAANGYTVDNATNEVVFGTMPAADADIKIDFLKNLPLLKEFDLGANVKAGSVSVKVNDVATTAFTVSAAGRLVMNAAPIDAAVVATKYERLIGADLEYTLPLIGNMFKNLMAYDKADNSPVSVSFASGKIVVAAASHREGKMVVLRYKNENSGKVDIELPHAPIMDSIMVDSGDVVCELGNGLELMDKTLKVSCEFDKETETSIKFKYKKTPLNKFLMAELLGLKDYVIVVAVNDVETKEFSVAGGMVTVNEEVPYDAVVKITVASKK